MRISYTVDFKNVSAVGLESSPVAKALAGLRANEARYFINKFKHVFIVVPAAESRETLDYVNRILKEERGIEFAAKPLETSRFQVENIKFAYVFYEDGRAGKIRKKVNVGHPRERCHFSMYQFPGFPYTKRKSILERRGKHELFCRIANGLCTGARQCRMLC